MSYDIMLAGHLCLDIIPQFHETGNTDLDQIMCPGKLTNIGPATISTGGIVSNTGVTMKKLGSNVCFCSCVGDDQFGDIIIDILKLNGNADGITHLKGQSSSYTVVISPPGVDRIFLHNPSTNDMFTADYLDIDMLKQCRHFHFGYPPLMEKMYVDAGKELTRLFKLAKECGVTTSCDMTLPDPASESGKAPWRKILENTLPYVDMFVPSMEEIFYMLHPEEFLRLKKEHNNAELIDFLTPSQYGEIADEILAMGVKVIAIKSGHRGFYVKTASKDKLENMGAAKPGDIDNWADRELWVPAYKVEKFGSATGSGDAAIGGFLAAFLNGLDIEKSLKSAACLGYQNVTALDSLSGIKDWQTTIDMIGSDMPVLDIDMTDDSWEFHEDLKIYSGSKDKLTVFRS